MDAFSAIVVLALVFVNSSFAQVEYCDLYPPQVQTCFHDAKVCQVHVFTRVVIEQVFLAPLQMHTILTPGRHGGTNIRIEYSYEICKKQEDKYKRKYSFV